jgi:hypothetical protein
VVQGVAGYGVELVSVRMAASGVELVQVAAEQVQVAAEQVQVVQW